MKRQDIVWVKNNGKTAHHDRFDGEDFTIEPGECVDLLADCAKLCFGFGEEDKTRCIQRLGWAGTSANFPEALKRLNAFSFHLSAPVGSGEQAGSPQGDSADSIEVREPERDRRPAPSVNVTEKLHLPRHQTAAA